MADDAQELPKLTTAAALRDAERWIMEIVSHLPDNGVTARVIDRSPRMARLRASLAKEAGDE